MGICTSKPQAKSSPCAAWDDNERLHSSGNPNKSAPTPLNLKSSVPHSPFFPFYSPSPSPANPYLIKSPSAAASTPHRLFKRPFPPPSPAKHIRAVLLRRQGKKKAAATAAIPEDEEEEVAELDKRFGYSKDFTSRIEVGEEVGRGHFGYTCSARFKKGEFKGQRVAVKVIPKSEVCRGFRPALVKDSSPADSCISDLSILISSRAQPDRENWLYRKILNCMVIVIKEPPFLKKMTKMIIFGLLV